MRLPRLLLRAISARQHRKLPLIVDGLSYGRIFRELIYNGYRDGGLRFSISMECDSTNFDLQVEMQNIRSQDKLLEYAQDIAVVSKWGFQGFSKRLEWSWEPQADEIVAYKGVGRVPFRGLLPDLGRDWTDAELSSQISALREDVEEFELRLEHLGPFRKGVRRVYEIGPVGPIDLLGEGAINHLVHDPQLLAAVGAWYQQNLEGWRLSLGQTMGWEAVEPMLSRGNTTVNLVEGGEGMQYLLPVVVQQLGCQLRDRGPFLHLIEEPELHLHAAAHAALGDLFLDTAKTRRGQVIVETHSENLLLRIRRRIAEGVVDPDLVAVYWVENQRDQSNVRRIEIMPDGEVDWWPEGVFSEGYKEVRAMRFAARNRGVG